MSQLSIQLFGSPRIVFKGQPVEIDTRKAVAMLAYLAVTGQRHSRDSLAVLLWPEYDHRRGRAALRRTLSALKTAVDGFGLAIERDSLGLDWSADIQVDIGQFADCLDQTGNHDHGRDEYCPACLLPLTSAVELYRGDFMAGFSLRDSVNFDDWQYLQSEMLRRQLSTALQGVIQCHQAAANYREAIDQAVRLLALDPLHEPAHRQLMKLYAYDGQRTAALKQYRDCVAILDHELGVPPLAETVALYEQILSGEIGDQRVSRTAAADGLADSVGVEPAAKDVVEEVAAKKILPLVGREGELSRLINWYSDAGGRGRLFVLEGEAGIGKTRLAQSFLEYGRQQGAAIAGAQCYQGEVDLAYTPFAEALDAAVHSWARSHSLDELPTHWLIEASRLIPDLAPKGSELFESSALVSPGEQRRFFEGVLQILGAVLGQKPPGILFIDDVHWADDSSLDLLSYIVRRLGRFPLFVLLTWRDEAFPGRQRLLRMLASAQREGMAEQLALGRLNEEAVNSLVLAVKSSTKIDAAAAGRLHQESEGLPFFVVEYLNMIANAPSTPEKTGTTPAISGVFAGSDERHNGNGQFTPLPMPEGVRQLLRSRLSTITDAAQQLLQSAAVIGRSFGYDILLETSGRSEEEAVLALEELQALGFLIEKPAEEAARYMNNRLSTFSPTTATVQPELDFSHEKIRLLVYEDMSLARRRLLHRRAGEAMLRQRHAPAASETSKSAQVANHFQRAGLEREAAHYYKEAGDTSRNLYANAEALGHYQSALALGYEETAVLHEAIGDLLTLRGDYENALTSYETAAAQIDGSDQSERLARLEMKLGGVYHRRGDWSIAASHYGQSLELSADSCQRARLLTEWSLTAHHGGESDRALALAKQAFEQAEEVGDKEALALAHNVLGILANSRGDYEEASQQLKESLALAEDLDNNSITIAALNNLSLSLRSSELQEEALLLVDEALSLCIEIGDRHREAALHNNMADLLHELGRSDEAMAHLKEAAAIYSDIGGEAGRWRPEIWMLTEW